MPKIEVSGSIDVAASPEAVYGLVSDLTRMGEWSPEATGGHWVGGATGPAEGAKFKGTNVNGSKRWTTTVTVTEAQAPTRFAFGNGLGPLVVARWSYRIDPAEGGGCRVTETWNASLPPGFPILGKMATGVGDREAHTRAMIETTLSRIKATAEGAGPA